MSNASPRAPAQDARKKRPLDLQRITFMWDLWTGLYMLEPWEKMVFSASPQLWALVLPAFIRALPPSRSRSPPLPPALHPPHAPTARPLPRRLPSGPI